jgi:hypothetical protein
VWYNYRGGENNMNNKESFKSLVQLHITRPGIEDLMAWIEASDFYIAPASTRYHESYEGGLVEHSLNVFNHLVKLNEHYGTGYNTETLAIVALFHDLCKIGCYKTSMRNVKNELTGVWTKVPYYTHDEDFKFGGHGSKSVFLLQNFIKLTPDEAVAVNCHMGVENAKWEVLEAQRACPLAFILHTADMASTIPDLNKED